MATDWAAEMKDRFEQFQRAFSEELRTQLAEAEERLDQRLADRLQTQLAEAEERLDRRLADRLEVRFSEAEARLDQRLSARLQVQTEELRELVRASAEGYGGTLEKIERDLSGFREEWRNKTADTDRILANHRERIAALERVTGTPGE